MTTLNPRTFARFVLRRRCQRAEFVVDFPPFPREGTAAVTGAVSKMFKGNNPNHMGGGGVGIGMTNS